MVKNSVESNARTEVLFAENAKTQQKRTAEIDKRFADIADMRAENEKRFAEATATQAETEALIAQNTRNLGKLDEQLRELAIAQAEMVKNSAESNARTEVLFAENAKNQQKLDEQLRELAAAQAEMVKNSAESNARTELRFEDNEKVHDRIDLRFDNLTEEVRRIAVTVAKLEGALAPWKLILGAVASIAVANVVSALGAKAIEALSALF